jgi:hypothetical protein
MAWSDVAAKIKFWGAAVDGTPATVNGIPAAGYGGAFSLAERRVMNEDVF